MRGVLAVVLLSACSLSFVKPPPPPEDCTTSKTWPHVDVGIGVAFGLTALWAGLVASTFRGDSDVENPLTAGEAAITGLVVAAVAAPWIASAVSGYGRVARCNDARATALSPSITTSTSMVSPR